MELGLHHRTETEQKAIRAQKEFREKIRIAAHDLECRKRAEADKKIVISLEKVAFEQVVQDTAILIKGDIRRIQDLVCDRMMIDRADLLSARRFWRSVAARQVGMYLCKAYTTRSYPEIGRRFGGRDHSTVIHAVQKIGAIESRSDGTAYGLQDPNGASDLIRSSLRDIRSILGPVT
jgi:chromosomal replication initiation ATPase DnaA